jgi:hypothetical protein
VGAVQWDLGFQGLVVLAGMSLVFGLIAQVVLGSITTRWLWLIGSGVFFVAGLFVSEVWFGWATVEELQPNIDGLSFDEVLLIAPIAGIASVVATWWVTRRDRAHRPTATS